MATRKVVCIKYPTGKTVKGRNNKTYPETKFLTVGSTFIDEKSGRIDGTFHAVPPQWDGRFFMLDPVWSKHSNVAGVTCYAPTPSPNFGPTALLWRDPQRPTGEQLGRG